MDLTRRHKSTLYCRNATGFDMRSWEKKKGLSESLENQKSRASERPKKAGERRWKVRTDTLDQKTDTHAESTDTSKAAVGYWRSQGAYVQWERL